jgi:hypothetical protein
VRGGGCDVAGSTGTMAMDADEDRAFHLERAAQCRTMAAESSDPIICRLLEELAEFHEAEAKRLGLPIRGENLLS